MNLNVKTATVNNLHIAMLLLKEFYELKILKIDIEKMRYSCELAINGSLKNII